MLAANNRVIKRKSFAGTYAKEETKFRFSVPELQMLIDEGVFQQYNNISLMD